MSTPLDRAAEVLKDYLVGKPIGVAADYAAGDALEAAINLEELARVLEGHLFERATLASQGIVGFCTCGKLTYRPTDPAREYSRHVAAAIRAHLLGED